MLQRLQELEDLYKRERLDHDREKRFNRDIQIHEMELMDQINKMRQVMVCAMEKLQNLSFYYSIL